MQQQDSPKKLWTIATVAKHFGEPEHRVRYVAVSRGIKPIGRAGGCRVFDQDALRAFEAALVEVRAAAAGAIAKARCDHAI